MEITTDRAQLLRKLRRAQLAAQAVKAERSTESGPRFKYASEPDVVEALRRVLLEAGLVVTVKGANLVQDQVVDMGKPGDPKRSFRSEVLVTFLVADPDTGYALEVAWPGVSLDSQDRGPRKAISDARKPFLLNLLLTYTTEDDPPPAIGFLDDDPPPPAGGVPSGPQAPASAPSSEAGGDLPPLSREELRAKELEELKELAGHARERLERWELEAVIRHQNLPDDRQAWEAKHYRQLLEVLDGSAQEGPRTATALQALAKLEPATSAQEEELAELLKGSGARLVERAKMESARASGWAWALEYAIEKLRPTKRG